MANIVKIPRTDLIAGVHLCIAQGRELLESSLLLVNAGKLEAAANEFSIGAQEIGKAKLLRDAFDSGEPQPEIKGFFDHNAKVEAARTLLGSSALWLKGATFQQNAFQSSAFNVGVPADEPTRREVVYVDYGSTGWRKPPSIEAADLRGHVVDALSILSSVEAKLTS